MAAQPYDRRAVRQERQERADNIYAQLTDTYEQIEQALDRGDSTRTLEAHWLALLDEYEELCDRLQKVQP